MSFIRGLDPKAAMGIGKFAKLDCTNLNIWTLDELEYLYSVIRGEKNIDVANFGWNTNNVYVPLKSLSNSEWITVNNKVVRALKKTRTNTEKEKVSKSGLTVGDVVKAKFKSGEATFIITATTRSSRGRITGGYYRYCCACMLNNVIKVSEDEKLVFLKDQRAKYDADTWPRSNKDKLIRKLVEQNLKNYEFYKR